MVNLSAVSNAANWAFDIYNRLQSVPAIKERLPGFLGMSLEDERIFAGFRTKLSESENKHLTDFLASLKDYERNRFINVVTGIPSDEVMTETTTTDGKKKISRVEKTSQAVPFLKLIAKLTEDSSPEGARQLCLGGRTILENPLHQRILKAWADSVKWFKENILERFDADSLDALKNKFVAAGKVITDNFSKAGSQLDAGLTKMEEEVQKRKKRPLWKRIFWA